MQFIKEDNTVEKIGIRHTSQDPHSSIEISQDVIFIDDEIEENSIALTSFQVRALRDALDVIIAAEDAVGYDGFISSGIVKPYAYEESIADEQVTDGEIGDEMFASAIREFFSGFEGVEIPEDDEGKSEGGICRCMVCFLEELSDEAANHSAEDKMDFVGKVVDLSSQRDRRK